ncbi:hypothetical protein QYF36_018157 [Acer negundo]|nr:hypothetical protein QYF36_018157 [Acer negundo]
MIIGTFFTKGRHVEAVKEAKTQKAESGKGITTTWTSLNEVTKWLSRSSIGVRRNFTSFESVNQKLVDRGFSGEAGGTKGTEKVNSVKMFSRQEEVFAQLVTVELTREESRKRKPRAGGVLQSKPERQQEGEPKNIVLKNLREEEISKIVKERVAIRLEREAKDMGFQNIGVENSARDNSTIEVVTKVIKTGVVLGFDYNGQESEIVEYVTLREEEDACRNAM